MRKLHIQWISTDAVHGDKMLAEKGRAIKARLRCSVEKPRKVSIPDQGEGWVIDVFVDIMMSYRDLFREIHQIQEVYEWRIE